MMKPYLSIKIRRIINLKTIMKPDNCSNDDFLFYLYKNKSELGLSWDDVADIMNKYEKKSYGESRYRKYCKIYFQDLVDENKKLEIEDCFDNEPTIEEKFDLAKETQRFKDERTQLNALYRQMSRESFLKDIAVECAKIVAEKIPFKSNVIVPGSDSKEGILLISDWHYGIDVNNHWNVYNPDICVSRLNKLKIEVGEIINDYDISKLYVLNLGDLISGRIHSQIRIENREDVVSQVIHVSEILASFLDSVSNDYCVNIEYYDCLDNHSRIEPNKKESLRLESLARIVTWYLEERFKESTSIRIKFNEYSDDIISFNCMGWKIAGEHGDLDTQSNIIKNLSGMLNDRPDLICAAHMHHFSVNESGNCIVVSNPSLIGMDSHAESKRYSSSPAQTMIIVSNKTPIHSLHRIVL